MPSEVGWSHHHGCPGGHQVGPLPVVPLDAVVARRAGRAGVVDAIEVGWTARLEPPAYTAFKVREMLELTEFELMKCRGIV